jgi:hypothetical protein
MKKIIFLTTVFACIVSTFNTFAEYTVTVNGPSHPLMKANPSRIDCDTVFSESEYASMPSSYTWSVIKRSEDGLTDTVYINSGIGAISVSRYNEKGQKVFYAFDYYPVISCKSPYTNPDVVPSRCKTDVDVYDYEYDSTGRLSKSTLRYINGDGKDSLVSETIIDYSTVQYTEKGYIYDDYEYEFDDLGRVTHIQYLNDPDEYKELDGKTYRIGDSYFTYFEGGVLVLCYERVSKNIYGWDDRWVKTDYGFRKDGYSKNVNTSFDGKVWSVWEKTETRYVYNSGDGADANENIESPASKVYGIANAVVINSADKAAVSIYNFTGQIVKHQQVGTGITQIPLPKGLFLVTVNDKHYKVVVK